MANLFLSQSERAGVLASMNCEGFRTQWSALRSRVQARTASPGLPGRGISTAWWYQVAEFLTDAAIIWAVEYNAPTDSAAQPATWHHDLSRWIRATTLSIVRRGEEDWVGPYFRDHTRTPRVGHLETAHLTIGVAVVLDVARPLFSDTEISEITAVLRDRAMPLCERWLDFAQRLNNWRCVLGAGLAVAAAVLQDDRRLARARSEYLLCCELFQRDGSYAESLQYADYAAWGLMWSYEALLRSGLGDDLTIDAYQQKVIWDTYSLLYVKPLSGWGQYPRPRSVNFNDCAAMYRASGELLAQIAARTADARIAGLARWLYDHWYGSEERPNAGPFDLATFGLFNAAGFLTFVLFHTMPAALAPAKADLSLARAFDNGDVFIRNDWDGHTVLAARAGGDLLNGPSHLHGDMNSFILVHRRERLLIDPGHSCYRNVTRSVEVDARVHNTCVFHPETVGREQDQRQEDLFKSSVLVQKLEFKRPFSDGRPGPAVDRGTRLLLLEQHGDQKDQRISALVADAAAVYGEPVTKFERVWLLVGEQLLVVADRVAFNTPCRVEWNWSLNNRDGSLEYDIESNRVISARRGSAGVKILHAPQSSAFMGPLFSVMHDHYHPEPAQPGEGRPGSAYLFRWTSAVATQQAVYVHLFLLDASHNIDRWQIQVAEDVIQVSGPGGALGITDYTVEHRESEREFLLRMTEGDAPLCDLTATPDGGYRLRTWPKR